MASKSGAHVHLVNLISSMDESKRTSTKIALYLASGEVVGFSSVAGFAFDERNDVVSFRGDKGVAVFTASAIQAFLLIEKKEVPPGLVRAIRW